MRKILILMAIIFCTGCFNAENQRLKQLQLFEGKDLENFDQKTIVELQTSILGKSKDNIFKRYTPRIILKIPNAQGQRNYMFIETPRFMFIPSAYIADIHLFNPEGKLLGTSYFSCGWRIIDVAMEVTKIPAIGRDVLYVDANHPAHGGQETIQYYALVRNQMMLVRLEDSKGQLIRNIYAAPNITIGDTIIGNSEEDWVKALESQDTAEVLVALTWLSGLHLNPQYKPSSDNWYHEKLNEAQLVDEVRSRKDVQAILQKLLLSENTWIKVAAQLAVNVEYYK